MDIVNSSNTLHTEAWAYSTVQHCSHKHMDIDNSSNTVHTESWTYSRVQCCAHKRMDTFNSSTLHAQKHDNISKSLWD